MIILHFEDLVDGEVIPTCDHALGRSLHTIPMLPCYLLDRRSHTRILVQAPYLDPVSFQEMTTLTFQLCYYDVYVKECLFRCTS